MTEMEAMTTRLRRRARLAYFRGRLLEARLELGVAVLLIAAAGVLAKDASLIIGPAVLLFTVTGALFLVGRRVGRSVLPGLLAGLLPLACALVAQHWGHVCTGSGCTSLCVPLCTGGGVLAGAVLARAARATEAPWVVWLSAGTLVLAAGSLGCACVGAGGVMGMSLGFLATGALLVLPRRGTK